MSVLDFFRRAPTISAAEAEAFLRDHKPGTYQLIDVREPDEYEEGHLRDADLIPLGALPSQLARLDPAKPTITYCAAGVRSARAAALLIRKGFADVHSLAGGLSRWSGEVVRDK